MKLGVMQAYFFPYIGYFQLINAVDSFICYEHVSFRKRSYINRNFILRKGDGAWIPITLPVHKKSHRSAISEVKIHEYLTWRKSFLELVRHNYAHAHFFDDIFPFLQRETDNEFSGIHEFNSVMIVRLAHALNLKVPISFINSNCRALELSLPRVADELNVDMKTARVIALCRQNHANCYVNPIGGTSLYDKKNFLRNRITVEFIQCQQTPYKQFGMHFEQDLSIIDVLMHCGFEQTSAMLDRYTLT